MALQVPIESNFLEEEQSKKLSDKLTKTAQ